MNPRNTAKLDISDLALSEQPQSLPASLRNLPDQVPLGKLVVLSRNKATGITFFLFV
jgi:hypothetical protein